MKFCFVLVALLATISLVEADSTCNPEKLKTTIYKDMNCKEVNIAATNKSTIPKRNYYFYTAKCNTAPGVKYS